MSIDGTPITIWCLEYGSSSFSVTIGNNNSIFDLKKAIFEEISVPDNVKAKNLSLWSVNVKESQLESNTPDGLMTDGNEIKIATQKVGNTFHGVQGNSIRVIVRAPVATEQPVSASAEDLADLFGQMDVTNASTASTSVSPLTMLVGVIKQNSEVMKQNSEIMKKMLIQSEKERDDTGISFFM